MKIHTVIVMTILLMLFSVAQANNKTVAAELTNHRKHSALDNFSRSASSFNEKLDKIFLRPVAAFYNRFVPQFMRTGVSNFFSNVDTLTTIANDALQLKLYYLLHDSWRLVINSTVGLLGLVDVASKVGLMPHHEDFGLTLARWGYTDSSYLVVPFLGPATIRDLIGWPIDYLMFSLYSMIPNDSVRYGLYGLGMIDRRGKLLEYQKLVDTIALDNYTFIKSAYIQHRNKQIFNDDM